MEKAFRFLIAFGVLFLIIYVATCAFSPSKTTDIYEQTKVNGAIPGLLPADVYLNFEKIGFKTEQSHSVEYGSTWTCTKQDAGIDYRVSVYSPDGNVIKSITATAMVNPLMEVDATYQFFAFTQTLPYDGADINKANENLREYFNTDKYKYFIGRVAFEILAPSDYVRTLTMTAME